MNIGGELMHPNNSLLTFSKKFNIPVDSPEITLKLIEEINKLKKEQEEG